MWFSLRNLIFLSVFLLTTFQSNSQYHSDPFNGDDSYGGSFKTVPELTQDSILNNTYNRPEKWGFIKHVPDDIWQLAKSPFQKKNLVGLSVVAGSTALLIWQDQAILDGALQFARNIHLSGETVNEVPLKIKDARIIKIPQNFNTFLYSLGEGGTSMYIAGGLYIYGRIKHDNRSLQAASDLTETFITMGTATQIVKRSTGRQTPFKSTQPGGRWQPFPPFKEYQQNTPVYDAFPSGHLATMVATVTVLSLHYPEKKWIKPIGYIVCALSSFAMMNTEVHWAGDYPLAFALGYVSGKIIVNRHKPKPRMAH